MFMARKQGETRLLIAYIAFYGTGSPNYRTTEGTAINLEEFGEIAIKSKF
jgi:hypothetical protein